MAVYVYYFLTHGGICVFLTNSFDVSPVLMESLSIAEISNIITIILYFMRVNSVSYTILEDPC
jgi:hypothetical protein